MKKYLEDINNHRMGAFALFLISFTCMFSISFTTWSLNGHLPEIMLNQFVCVFSSILCSIVLFVIFDFTVGLGRPSPLIKKKEKSKTEKTEGYEIVELNGQKGIKCLECNITSYHPEDVNHKYTHCCGKFHHG